MRGDQYTTPYMQYSTVFYLNSGWNFEIPEVLTSLIGSNFKFCRVLNNNPVMNYFRCSCLINLNQSLIWNPPTDRFSNQALSYQIQHPHQHRRHFFPSFEFWEIFEFKENIFPKLWKIKKKKDFIGKSNVEKWVIQGKPFFFYKHFRDILPGKFGNSQCKHCWRIHSVCSAQANCCWGEFLKNIQFYPIC